MKKLLIILFSIINIILLVFCIILYKDYDKAKEKLSDKLVGNEYDVVINNLESERDKIVNDINESSGYVFKTVNDFKEIKDSLDKEYEKLNLENSQLVSKKKNLSEQKNNLSKIYNDILLEELKKTEYIIKGVPLINQYSLGYPTGCESAALSNLLRFWGVSASIKDVVKLLPKGKLPYYEDGVKYGGNPYLEFVGTPTSRSSYGVYEKPIIGVANQFKSGIIDGTGMSLNSVLDIVKEDRPVIVWVSMNMAVPYISTSWKYKPTGEKISWMANEHALVVIGYNKNQVIVSDSLNGKVRYYDKKVFESRYKTYGKRAIYY